MKPLHFILLTLHLGAVYKRVTHKADSRVSCMTNQGSIGFFDVKAGERTEHLSPTGKSAKLSEKKFRRHWPDGTIEKLMEKGLVERVRAYSLHSPMIDVELFNLTRRGVLAAKKLAESLKKS